MNRALFPRQTPTQESNPGANLQSKEQTETTSEIVRMIFSYVEAMKEYYSFDIEPMHDRCKRLPSNHAKWYDKNNYGELQKPSGIVA